VVIALACAGLAVTGCGGGEDEPVVECSDGEQAVDPDGDEVPESCAPVVDDGAIGDPCSLDHPCAGELRCFFRACAGMDCEHDVGTCTDTSG
jgi:hypothetical protein